MFYSKRINKLTITHVQSPYECPASVKHTKKYIYKNNHTAFIHKIIQ